MLIEAAALMGGIAVGMVAGMLPGIHPNTVFVILVSGLAALSGVPLAALLVFIVAVSVANTISSFIPALVFGAPEAETSLGVLPGHQYVLQGKGPEALYLTVVGGVGVTFLVILTFPLLLMVVPSIQQALTPIMHFFLAAIVLWMCFTDRSPARAGVVFVAAGVFGVVVLQRLPEGMVLFPALTGLFGFSQLAGSMQAGNIPQQDGNIAPEPGMGKGIIAGYLAGFFAAIFPGIGSAQAGILTAQVFKAETKDFLVSLGGINTANILFTFITYVAAGKTRSGAVWAVSQVAPAVTMWDLGVMLAAGAAACCLSAYLTLKIGRWMLKALGKVNYQAVTVMVIIGLIGLVILFSGWLGLLVAAGATCLGVACIRQGVRRVQLMGFLVLPTIIYFAGMGAVVVVMLGL